MEPHLERVEVEPVFGGNHDLAVDDAARWQPFDEGLMQFREVAIEGFQVPALNVNVVTAAEDDGPEAVPLGLEEQTAGGGDLIDELGKHGLDGRSQHRLDSMAV